MVYYLDFTRAHQSPHKNSTGPPCHRTPQEHGRRQYHYLNTPRETSKSQSIKNRNFFHIGTIHHKAISDPKSLAIALSHRHCSTALAEDIENYSQAAFRPANPLARAYLRMTANKLHYINPPPAPSIAIYPLHRRPLQSFLRTRSRGPAASPRSI